MSSRLSVRVILCLAATLGATGALAASDVRWTLSEDTDARFEHVLARINAETGYALTAADFRLGEDRDLAYTHYQRWDQVLSDLSVKGMSLRLWTTQGSQSTLVQAEARVEAPEAVAPDLTRGRGRARTLRAATSDLSWANTLALRAIASSDDATPRDVRAETSWSQGRLVRTIEIKAQRGVHSVEVDVLKRNVIHSTYRPFATSEGQARASTDEYSVPALVYPIYEENGTDGQLLPRKTVELKHLLKRRPASLTTDPYAPLRARQYLYSLLDPTQGETQEGRDAGYWSMDWLEAQAATLRAEVPQTSNRIASGEALLFGRYATINIHPAAFDAFPNATIEKRYGVQLLSTWKPVGEDDYEIIPSAAFLGQSLDGRRGALKRPAVRDPQHDAATYINDGFDEVQVYYAINQLFESLRPLGFTDPELGSRPFHAFLFDPDIEMRDNAFYTDDTINFTTYSPTAPNMARDNTTIWHELGHGVMDRLMGDRLNLADTGGLSEGMADFVAEMVLRETNGELDFPGADDRRIRNATAFFLTNEVHDDGEAYGGVMKTILDLAIQRDGRDGLHKVTDLVLEAMRLSRDHPELTAQVWFDRVFFADQLGRPGVRAAGELHDLIQAALDSRNFGDEATRANYSFKYAGAEVLAGELGSRGRGVPLELAADAISTQTLAISLHDGEAFKFKYPVEVRVFYNSGPLQGAIDWVGEDTEPALFTITGPDQPLSVPVQVRGQCDEINRTDGRCGDFAYVQLFNAGETQPIGKKRFYLTIKTL